MINYMKYSLVALVLGLLVQAPALSSVVFTYNNGLSCQDLSGGCSIGTNGNLAEGSQGYSAISGFDSLFARGTSITASLNGMSAHTTISIDFLLAVIDSWDGLTPGAVSPDIFEVKVDGVTVFSAGYNIFDPNDQSPVRGTQLAYNTPLGFGPWNDAAYDMSSVSALHNIAHTASDMTVSFLFANSQGIDDESFAIENLRISANTATVPEPSALALLGLGLAGLGALRKKQKTA